MTLRSSVELPGGRKRARTTAAKSVRLEEVTSLLTMLKNLPSGLITCRSSENISPNTLFKVWFQICSSIILHIPYLVPAFWLSCRPCVTVFQEQILTELRTKVKQQSVEMEKGQVLQQKLEQEKAQLEINVASLSAQLQEANRRCVKQRHIQKKAHRLTTP